MRLAEAKNMMRWLALVSGPRLVALVASVIVALAMSPIDAFAQTTGACADSTNVSTRFYRDYYRIAVSSAESNLVAFRSRTGLPALAETQVRIVGDTTVCRSASAAFDAHLLDRFPANPVIVLELGTKRIVIKDVGLVDKRINFLFNQDFSTLLSSIMF
jgi:hypothetical protein